MFLYFKFILIINYSNYYSQLLIHNFYFQFYYFIIINVVVRMEI